MPPFALQKPTNSLPTNSTPSVHRSLLNTTTTWTSSANPRPTNFPITTHNSITTSKSRTVNIHLSVQSTALPRSKPKRFETSSRRTSIAALSTSRNPPAALPFYSPRRRTVCSDFASIGAASTLLPKRIAIRFHSSRTSSIASAIQTSSPRSTSVELTTLSASLPVMNGRPPSEPATAPSISSSCTSASPTLPLLSNVS